jgi:hypothetical protein
VAKYVDSISLYRWSNSLRLSSLPFQLGSAFQYRCSGGRFEDLKATGVPPDSTVIVPAVDVDPHGSGGSPSEHSTILGDGLLTRS